MSDATEGVAARSASWKTRFGGCLRRDLLRPNQARSLQPGVSGFLFSVNPQHADRAKREVLTLLTHYLERLLEDDAEECADERGGKRAPRAETVVASNNNGNGVASGLAEELAAVVSAKRSGGSSFHPLLREVDTKVKGYLFISVSMPDDESAGTTTATAAEGESAAGAVVDPRNKVGEENTLVAALADAMWIDLIANPRPVARFSFRCFPCGLSCIPTRPDLISEAAVRMATAWYRESVLDDTSRPQPALPAAVWVSVIVRNNSNIDAGKEALRLAVARALPKEHFLAQPIYVASAAAAIAATGRPTLQIAVLVMHSIALVSLQPWFESRFDYNLNAVCEKALSTLTASAPVTTAVETTLAT